MAMFAGVPGVGAEEGWYITQLLFEQIRSEYQFELSSSDHNLEIQFEKQIRTAECECQRNYYHEATIPRHQD